MIEFDTTSGMWVARGEEAVRAALAHPQLRVRPPAEPVPRALLGRPTGEVFALLVRMNDGQFHARHRPGVEQRTAAIRRENVERAAAQAAATLCRRLSVDELLTAIPVRTMADVIGVTADDLDTVTAQVLAFVRGIGPGASGEDILQSDAACTALMAQGERLGLDRVASANRIALMQQACDATAGLIGLSALRVLAQGVPDDWYGAVAHGLPAQLEVRRRGPARALGAWSAAAAVRRARGLPAAAECAYSDIRGRGAPGLTSRRRSATRSRSPPGSHGGAQ